MSTPILATKLYIPPARPKVVPRPRLIERLSEGLHGKLTLISAPAGFGKTTLVSEWVAALTPSPLPAGEGPGVRVAWLSLDARDSDPTRFLAYLVAALQTLFAGIGAGVMAALDSPQPPPIEPLLTILLNEIAAIPADPSPPLRTGSSSSWTTTIRLTPNRWIRPSPFWSSASRRRCAWSSPPVRIRSFPWPACAPGDK
ncbi:hypothetical protein [Candidatus Amarolinea dominans]|uniref:hypothetical protein n=1 Tax=Candidatus Amarolinea dominans TaxID=3140696 RepID=UPI0031CC967B